MQEKTLAPKSNLNTILIVGSIVLLGAASLFYFGFDSTQSKFDLIHPGMTNEEVESLLGGTPDKGYGTDVRGGIQAYWGKNFRGAIFVGFEKDPITNRLVVKDKLYLNQD